MKIFYEDDANISIIQNLKVTIVGYGSQGHAHANNLHESGVDVTVALREGSSSWSKAESAGLKVSTVSAAVTEADLVMILAPDEFQQGLYESEIKPNLKPGGWAFQYNNSFYPDVDDSALIGMLLDRHNKKSKNKTIASSIQRTRNWIIGMQSNNGGWGSFDTNNNYSYLNNIPFAAHGALLDPPTADVTARCISFLAQINNKEDKAVINKAVKYIISEQKEDGSWYGRWGTNYIYGTWSVLSALNLINFKEKNKIIEKSIFYNKGKQRNDGGWGESGQSYYEDDAKKSE